MLEIIMSAFNLNLRHLILNLIITELLVLIK